MILEIEQFAKDKFSKKIVIQFKENFLIPENALEVNFIALAKQLLADMKGILD